MRPAHTEAADTPESAEVHHVASRYTRPACAAGGRPVDPALRGASAVRLPPERRPCGGDPTWRQVGDPRDGTVVTGNAVDCAVRAQHHAVPARVPGRSHPPRRAYWYRLGADRSPPVHLSRHLTIQCCRLRPTRRR